MCIKYLSPEGWEDRSQHRVDDEPQHKIVAECAVMQEADRGEPARPDWVTRRRLSRTRK